MTYTLNLELTGGEEIKNLLSQLKGLSGGLGGGSIFGGGGKPARDVSDIATQMDRAGKLTAKMRSELDKISSTGGRAALTLKNMFAGWGNDFYRIREFFRDNPSQKSGWLAMRSAEKLAAMPQAPKGYKGVMWGSQMMQVAAIQKMQMAAMPGWLKNLPSGISTGPQQSGHVQLWKLHIKQQKAAAAAATKALKDDVTFKKDMSFLLMPMFNPGSMWATMFASRQTFSAMNTAHGSALRSSMMGGMGAGAATAVLVGASTAVGFALKGLEKIVQETAKAFENARQLYAHALTTGMGLQFTAKRSMMANIIGVSETELFRFGAQMAYLNPKLAEAANILAKTAVPLTQVSWQLKILQADFSAMFAQLANDAAPAIMTFLGALDSLVKFLNRNAGILVGMIGGAAAAAFPTATSLWSDIAMTKKIFGKDGGAGGFGGMPGPQAWMKQLPASAWEKMGLIIGGGGGNYAKETAQNTRSMAKDMRTLVANIMKGGPSKATTWGMSPQTANP